MLLGGTAATWPLAAGATEKDRFPLARGYSNGHSEQEQR
jgi:hypothetical protein